DVLGHSDGGVGLEAKFGQWYRQGEQHGQFLVLMFPPDHSEPTPLPPGAEFLRGGERGELRLAAPAKCTAALTSYQLVGTMGYHERVAPCGNNPSTHSSDRLRGVLPLRLPGR